MIVVEGSARPERESAFDTVRDLKDLTRLIQTAPGFAEMLASLKNDRGATLDGAWGSAAALATAAVGLHAPKLILVVLAHIADVDDFRDDLAGFAGTMADIFPYLEKSPDDKNPDHEIFGKRLRLLRDWADPEGDPSARFVVTSLQALMQPVPSAETIRSLSRTIRVGETVRVEELAGWLLDRRLTRVEVVEVAGEFSLRGGILDVFPGDATEPFRIEFFGDDIESIRPFDPETQRSLGRRDSLTLTPLARLDRSEFGHAADALPKGTWVALIEPNDLREEGRNHLARLEDPADSFDVETTFAKLFRLPSIAVSALAGASLETTCNLRIESVERFSGELGRVKTELDAAAGGDRVLIACHNQGEAERLAEVFSDTALASEGRLSLVVGRIRAGFRSLDAKTLVLGDHELFARTDVRRPSSRRRYESRAIDSFLDLNEGDYVVHLNHGIAIYRGLEVLDKGDDHADEALALEFAEKSRMYVSISKIHLVQKYVGGGGKAVPTLSRLGSSAWEKRKKRVADAVVDLASELIDIQAARESKPGIAYPSEDSRWLAEFEASFPYQATPDQLAAIDAVKKDMAKSRPMDRLICGDVGYGKTEVAMRAAFKAIDAGKQVAVLVPTTVLAEQHQRSFSERMAEFPFVIESVSRFRPKGQIREVLRRTAAGAVDILIGTHRIVQKDVSFKDLGLVVIDEEQRFGVEDKEWLKTLRSTVDVLTLSATPIPRTLHMSLLGLRDISNLETPPPDRKAIETRIVRFDDELIRRAIRRELDRDGQVYFVHNRIYDIEALADRIQSIVPEARILIGHGRMTGEKLERAMLAFVRGQADVLVATTIIESGVDIPNVNTIFIDEADKYGLADLHQLRGRVGRYKHRAYAYLLLDSDKPVTPNATKRLKAIEEFAELGAGFKIALRDLEIRGAGNILGAEQSGHIESVGYELYCSLLEGAVRSLTGRKRAESADCAIELRWRAYLPKTYVPSPRVKIECYRRLGKLADLDAAADFRRELIDRFGPLPKPAENLLAEAELRILANRWKIARVHVEDEYAVLTYQSAKTIERLSKIRPGRVRVADHRTAYVPFLEKHPPGAVVAAALRELLTI